LSLLQKYDEDFWKELEINYSRVKELVNENLRDQCVKLSGINKIAVEVMCEFLEEPYSRPKLDTLERIGNIDQVPICIMLALKEFLKRKDGSIILSYFDELKRDNINPKMNKHYNSIKDESEKNLSYERLLFLLLFYDSEDGQPHALKQIMALDTISSVNIPTYKQTKGITLDRHDMEREMDRILQTLKKKDRNNMDYIKFCDFEKDGSVYCFIKRQVDDKIERQVKDNIRSKPGEFLSYIIINNGKGLQVKASRQWILGNSVKVLQEKMLGGNAEFILDIPIVTAEDFENLAEKALNEENKLKILEIQVRNSPFKGAPSVRIWSDSDIIRCLLELGNSGFNLLNPENLQKIAVDFEGKKEKIYFNPDNKTVPIYKGDKLSPKEQKRFEDQIKTEYGFPVMPGG
jgi:hypothetical protein